MREIILDTETTGLDPVSGHRLVEIGCVEMIGGARTGNTFHCYLNPDRDVPVEAFNVHGLSTEFLRDKPRFRDIAQSFMDFIADAALVIHNAAFDMKFLNHELKTHGYVELPMSRAIDTVAIARKKFPGSPANLDALCRRFDIDIRHRTKHGALLDAELLSEVYIELTGGRQVMISFAGQEPEREERVDAVIQHEPVSVPPRAFPLSAEEAERHRALIAKLKAPIWAKYEA